MTVQPSKDDYSTSTSQRSTTSTSMRMSQLDALMNRTASALTSVNRSTEVNNIPQYNIGARIVSRRSVNASSRMQGKRNRDGGITSRARLAEVLQLALDILEQDEHEDEFLDEQSSNQTASTSQSESDKDDEDS